MERPPVKKMKLRLFSCHREHAFAKEHVLDISCVADPNLFDLTKVLSLFEINRVIGSCEMVKRLWSDSGLIAERTDNEVNWSHNVALVSSVEKREQIPILKGT